MITLNYHWLIFYKTDHPIVSLKIYVMALQKKYECVFTEKGKCSPWLYNADKSNYRAEKLLW